MYSKRMLENLLSVSVESTNHLKITEVKQL